MPIDPTTATRVRYDGMETYLGAALTTGATTITFAARLGSDGDAPIADLQANEYLPLSLLDANFRLAEIVYLTQYSSGNTTGTIERAVEGTTAKAFPVGSKVVHSATVADFTLVQDHSTSPSAHANLVAQANAYTDGVMADHLAAADPHAVYAKKAGDTFTGPVTFSGVTNTTTVAGILDIPAGATLSVEGDLRITGRFFLNGREIVASNTPPSAPSANQIYIQTFG